MGELVIYDLHARLAAMRSSSPLDRMAEAGLTLPPVGVVALNGIPFIGSDPVTYFGHPVTEDSIREQAHLALGLGGVLTYMNTSKFSLEDLADLSLKHGHDWSMHSVNATLCFAGAPTFVEISFARDSRFHMAWVEPRSKTDWNCSRVFTATASLKQWKKYTANRDSRDFLATQREWLQRAHEVLQPLFPAYLS